MNFDLQVYIRMFLMHNIRYLLFAGIAFLLFYVLWKNKKVMNKIQQRAAGKKDIWRELSHSLLNGFILAAAGYLLIATPLRSYTKIYSDVQLHGWLYLFTSVLLMLVFHDTYFYWAHRVMHHKKIFRFVHLVHHQSTNPTPFASYSFHALETILETGIIFILPFIVPLHPLAIMLFSTVGLSINIYGHLGYEIMPRWFRPSFLFEVINTSIYHNMHHSKFKGNYGLYFRLWDRLLKTEHPEYVKEYDRIQAQRFGTPSITSKTIVSKKVAATFILLLSASIANAQIEGRWKNEDKDAVIEIYKENNKYYGKVVWTTPENQKKIPAGKTLIVLRDFEKKDAVTFINGTIKMVRKKRTVKGTLVLKNANTLEVQGTYMGYEGKQTWIKV